MVKTLCSNYWSLTSRNLLKVRETQFVCKDRNVSLGGRSCQLFWLSPACRGTHFSTVEEDEGTGLALPGPWVSGFLWQNSKCARQFTCGILQYTSGLEVLACGIDTNVNYYKIYSKNTFSSIKIEIKISICRVFSSSIFLWT